MLERSDHVGFGHVLGQEQTKAIGILTAWSARGRGYGARYNAIRICPRQDSFNIRSGHYLSGRRWRAAERYDAVAIGGLDAGNGVVMCEALGLHSQDILPSAPRAAFFSLASGIAAR
jgi:hypothetical protein